MWKRIKKSVDRMAIIWRGEIKQNKATCMTGDEILLNLQNAGGLWRCNETGNFGRFVFDFTTCVFMLVSYMSLLSLR